MPRANEGGITINPKTFGHVRGAFMTKYQSAPKGFTGTVKHGRFIYDCTSDGEGSVIINFKYKGQVLFVTKNDLKKI